MITTETRELITDVLKQHDPGMALVFGFLCLEADKLREKNRLLGEQNERLQSTLDYFAASGAPRPPGPRTLVVVS